MVNFVVDSMNVWSMIVGLRRAKADRAGSFPSTPSPSARIQTSTAIAAPSAAGSLLGTIPDQEELGDFQ
jgi:hypothetical protein